MNSHQGDRNYEQNTDIFKVKSAKSKQMELIASAAEKKKNKVEEKIMICTKISLK